MHSPTNGQKTAEVKIPKDIMDGDKHMLVKNPNDSIRYFLGGSKNQSYQYRNPWLTSSNV